MKFVCDAMLHKLCVWLRMAGHECIYVNSREGDEVIKTALKNEAVLLTRDEDLAQKAASYCRAQLIHSHGYLGQLKEVVCGNKIKLKFSERFCTVCGSKLSRVAKKSVRGKVWPFTYKTHTRFFQCAQCKHIFWRGSHWKKIKTQLASITA